MEACKGLKFLGLVGPYVKSFMVLVVHSRRAIFCCSSHITQHVTFWNLLECFVNPDLDYLILCILGS